MLTETMVIITNIVIGTLNGLPKRDRVSNLCALVKLTLEPDELVIFHRLIGKCIEKYGYSE